MPRRHRVFIGLAVIVIFGGLGLWSLTTTATPYVDFATAKKSPKIVQVLGKVSHDSTTYDSQTGQLVFSILNEKGETMTVRYLGARPGNLDQAESVVCIGRYQNGVFEAEKLLVKCPSKYQGTEFGSTRSK